MIELGYRARGGSGYNSKKKKSPFSSARRRFRSLQKKAIENQIMLKSPSQGGEIKEFKEKKDPEVVRIKSELGHYDRYKQETLQQQRKNRLETERDIKLLKREYVEDLKDFRNGKYPNTTLNELRSDYIRELNMYLKQLKNPYPKLIPVDSDNYGP